MAGGKYTTYRVMAADAVDRALSDFPGEAPRSQTTHVPLVGAVGYAETPADARGLAARAGLGAPAAERLLGRYGGLLGELLGAIGSEPGLGAPVPGAGGYLLAEARYAASHEGARHLADVLERRTRIASSTRTTARPRLRPRPGPSPRCSAGHRLTARRRWPTTADASQPGSGRSAMTPQLDAGDQAMADETPPPLSAVPTTVERTLTGGAPRRRGRRGAYRRLAHGAGEPRLAAGPAGVGSALGAGATSLLRLVHLTDLQLADVESPGRFEFFEELAGRPGAEAFVPASGRRRRWRSTPAR